MIFVLLKQLNADELYLNNPSAFNSLSNIYYTGGFQYTQVYL